MGKQALLANGDEFILGKTNKLIQYLLSEIRTVYILYKYFIKYITSIHAYKSCDMIHIILFSQRWGRNKDFQRCDTLFSNTSRVLGTPFTNSQRAQSL